MIDILKYTLGSTHKTKNSGKVQVLEHVGRNRVRVRFMDTGNEKVITIRTLKHGDAVDWGRPTVNDHIRD